MKIISPHLTIHRLSLNMLASMLHRITGFTLFFLIVMYINIYALTLYTISPTILSLFNIFYISYYNFFHFIFIFCTIFHLLHGVTHLFWDKKYNLSLNLINLVVYLEILISILITLIYFII